MSHEKQTQVLDFWFGEDPLKEVDNMEKWFSKNASFDESIRAQFQDMVTQAAQGAFDDWGKTPRGALALVILLDQFPRNIFRNDPRSFANDEHARRIAEMALDRGFDQQLNTMERCFLYLPLEHSEDISAQDRSVALFKDLAASALPEESKAIAEAFEYALRHRDIIQQFGRFPHRNEILGRDSTKAEAAFLKTPNSGF
ncbi:MAG: DUF924 domain-containing protein [Proteobacteria bacterium]|nr:MAG: DUF924 domain-containing protein [Pseudomonadota bacterium]